MTIKEKFNSPNHYKGRNDWKPDMIVLHVTAGDKFSSCKNWFLNADSQTCSHFVIDKDGSIYQFVDLENGAWCNGNSINSAYPTYYGNATSQAVRERKTTSNYYTYSIEFVDKDGNNITDEQVNSGIETIQYISQENEKLYSSPIIFDREHIIGHCEVAPLTKPNCPGKNFPFDKIIKGLNPDKTIYRVQVGAFTNKQNADNLCEELKEKGYNGYVVAERG